MAYYNIGPRIGKTKNSEGKVVGFNVSLMLVCGIEDVRFTSHSYKLALEFYERLKNLNSHIKVYDGVKHCLKCGEPSGEYPICEKHLSTSVDGRYSKPFKIFQIELNEN